jgi:hypothetical protein
MDVLTVVLACSLHPDQELVRTLIEDAGGRQNAYFVGDLTSLNTYETLTSKEQALGVVSDLERKGGRPAVGLFAVPVSWAGRFGRRPADLFDACTNVAIGTAVLAAHEATCRTELEARTRRRRKHTTIPVEATRTCTLERYGAELGIANFSQAILKAMATRQLAAATLPSAGDEDGAPERSPVFVDGSTESTLDDHAWSSPLLYLAPSSPTALEAERTNGAPADRTSTPHGRREPIGPRAPATTPGVEMPPAPKEARPTRRPR